MGVEGLTLGHTSDFKTVVGSLIRLILVSLGLRVVRRLIMFQVLRDLILQTVTRKLSDIVR